MASNERDALVDAARAASERHDPRLDQLEAALEKARWSGLMFVGTAREAAEKLLEHLP